MQAAKEKVSNVMSSAKQSVDTKKAKAQEKMDKGTATTKGEKEMAKETRKAKEAESKMNLHEDKARNKANREAAAHEGHAAQLGRHAANPTNGKEALRASHEQHGGHFPASTAPPGQPTRSQVL